LDYSDYKKVVRLEIENGAIERIGTRKLIRERRDVASAEAPIRF